MEFEGNRRKSQAQEPFIKWAIVLLVAMLGLMVLAVTPNYYELPSTPSGLDAAASNSSASK
jgi:hypothetical protein